VLSARFFVLETLAAAVDSFFIWHRRAGIDARAGICLPSRKTFGVMLHVLLMLQERHLGLARSPAAKPA